MPSIKDLLEMMSTPMPFPLKDIERVNASVWTAFMALAGMQRFVLAQK